MTQSRIGLLPLYLELYDRSFSEHRPRMDEFHRTLQQALRRKGLDVLTVPPCRLQAEFKAAIRKFESAGVDALVTVHLAYSPSLESAAVLAATPLPLIVLDTTPTFDFSPKQAAVEIMYNHGIHGVQDMCNLLLRNRKPFQLVAGHWQRSNVLDRVIGLCRAARVAKALRSARVGLIGSPFKGMGDFDVAPAVLKRTIGPVVVKALPDELRRLAAAVKETDVRREMAADRQRFDARGLSAEAHRRTSRVSLTVRSWLEKHKLTAFSVNFLAINKAMGLPVMPFLEASKAMARGIGYAGEGDTLTAGLVGALASVYPDTTFTEMFCPDWKGSSVFLSHMGEMNVDLAAGKPKLKEAPFHFTDADKPAVAAGLLRGGPAVFVNLAPLADRRYRLIVAPGTMLKVKGKDGMTGTVHGWFKSTLPVAEFLAAYSRQGGTHHAALVYGKVAPEIADFGRFMNWETVTLE